MQEDPTTNDTDTGSNTPYFEMDREDWEIAFEAFKDTGYTTIRMGMNIRMDKAPCIRLSRGFADDESISRNF